MNVCSQVFNYGLPFNKINVTIAQLFQDIMFNVHIYPRGDIGQQEDDTPYVRSLATISSKIVILVLGTNRLP